MSVRPEFDSVYKTDFRRICASGIIRPYVRLALFPPSGANMYFSTWPQDTSANYSPTNGRLLDVKFPEHAMDWASVDWSADIAVTDQTIMQLFIQRYYANTVAPWRATLSFWFLTSSATEEGPNSYVIATGIMTDCQITDDGEIAVAHCRFDSGLGVWDRSSEQLYTTEHQKCSGNPSDPDRSGDRGFEHVPYLAAWKGVWGKPIPPVKRQVKVKKKGRLK